MEERFGPWRVERRVASGALAEVVTARRDGDSTAVAVKRLHPHQSRDADVVSLFDGEIRLTRDMAPHPRLVRGLDAGVADGRPWLALGLVDGADLRRRLDAGERPAPATALARVLDTCAAVEHMHGQGWIHGDVNPTNLLVDGAGQVTLCDLGVARRRGEGGPVRGTHAYMAPEQVRGEPWTDATDVFALGVILWELIAGQRLFFRGPTYLTMAAVVDAPAPPLADTALDAIVQRALHKDPAGRIATAAELGALLRSYSAGLS